MLSRVANSFYWMVRYIERADNMARLLDVNQQLLLDYETIDSERLRALWRPIVVSTGDEGLFGELFGEAGSREVTEFLTLDRRNPGSIVSCVAQARENARMVRDQIADDLWEEINALYLFVTSGEALGRGDAGAGSFYRSVRRGVQTVFGIADSSMTRGEAWKFMELGRYLERADKTTRFLDITSHLPGSERLDGRAGLYGPAILRSCSALGAYRSEFPGEMAGELVVRFLLFSPVFPRSVRFCIERVDDSLHAISGSPRGGFANEAERVCGRVLASLSYGSSDEVFGAGVHEVLDGLQASFNDIGDAVFETYVLMPEKIAAPAAPAAGMAAALRWEIEQMQQQQ